MLLSDWLCGTEWGVPCVPGCVQRVLIWGQGKPMCTCGVMGMPRVNRWLHPPDMATAALAGESQIPLGSPRPALSCLCLCPWVLGAGASALSPRSHPLCGHELDPACPGTEEEDVVPWPHPSVCDRPTLPEAPAAEGR